MRRVQVDFILASTALLLLSACGTQTERTLIGQPLVIPTPVVIVSPTPTPSPTSSSTPFDSAYAYSFQVTGSGGTAPSYTTGAINTDNLLVIKVNAGPAGQLSVPGFYSNFTANYNCVAYNITVGGRTVTTQTLKVPNASQSWYAMDQCPGAPSSQIINFSDRASPGHGDMFVTVSNARYDFYCDLYYQGMLSGTPSMYCPLRTAYMNHTLTGTIDVQVNGTIF
jgi:hypothetical protein